MIETTEATSAVERLHPYSDFTSIDDPLPGCIRRLIEPQVEQRPEAVAITAPGRHALTYGGLWRQVDETVAALNAMGVGRNDRVALVLPNGPEMAVAFIAIAVAATNAPLNPAYRAREFDLYLSDLNAQALVIQSGFDSPAIAAARARDIPIIELSPVWDGPAGTFTLAGEKPSPAASPGFAQSDDVALVLHTSGTTSKPKIVPLTQRNICAAAGDVCRARKLSRRDRCLNIMPLFHVYGVIVTLSTLASGGSVVCTPGLDDARFFEWLETFRPTWYTAVPTMHQAILAQAASYRESAARGILRFISSSSAPLPALVRTELEAVFGAPVRESYGMTEACLISSMPLPPRPLKPGSVGLPAGPAVAVLDAKGERLPPGATGEIAIRGASVMRGYENNPEANESAFTGGWFRTGDQGHRDEDGFLFLSGRIKEIINRGGEKIAPREVDEVLMEHPAVLQAVTFAAPHPKLGESVAAAVILRAGAAGAEPEIRAFAAARLADFKVPDRVLIVDALPKGPTGKLQRIGLAQKLGLTALEPAGSSLKTAARTPVEEKLVAIWTEVLNRQPIGIEDNFLQMGGDSILAIRVMARVRDCFDLQMAPRALFEAPTIARLAVAITQAMAEKTGAEELERALALMEALP